MAIGFLKRIIISGIVTFPGNATNVLKIFDAVSSYIKNKRL